MTIHVRKAGLLTTVQAAPRTGLRHIGVPARGPADPLSMALANRLVGNDLLLPDYVYQKVGGLSLRHLFVAELFRRFMSPELETLLLTTRDEQIPPEHRWMEGIEPYRQAVESIGSLAGQRGIPVLNFVDRQVRLSALDDPEAWEQIDALQARLGIHSPPDFTIPSGPEYHVAPTNYHMNARANTLIVAQMIEAMEQLDVCLP